MTRDFFIRITHEAVRATEGEGELLRGGNLRKALYELCGISPPLARDEIAAWDVDVNLDRLIQVLCEGNNRQDVLRTLGAALRKFAPEAADVLESYGSTDLYGSGSCAFCVQSAIDVAGVPQHWLASEQHFPGLVHHARCILSMDHQGDHVLAWQQNQPWPPMPSPDPTAEAMKAARKVIEEAMALEASLRPETTADIEARNLKKLSAIMAPPEPKKP